MKTGTKFDSNLHVEFVHRGLLFGTSIWLVSSVLEPKLLVMTCQQPLVNRHELCVQNMSVGKMTGEWHGKGCSLQGRALCNLPSYIQRCARSLHLYSYNFEGKQPSSCTTILRFTFLVPFPGTRLFSSEFVCPIIYNLPRSC